MSLEGSESPSRESAQKLMEEDSPLNEQSAKKSWLKPMPLPMDTTSLRCCFSIAMRAPTKWTEIPMTFLNNDRWRASFTVTGLGRWCYTITGWVDHFATWRGGLLKKLEAKQDVQVDLLIGAKLIEDASRRATTEERHTLARWGKTLASGDTPEAERIRLALSAELETVMARYPDRRVASTYDRELTVVVDREKARFSAWYEMFPRSWSQKAGKHGTFKDCEARLPYIASMGFDVLYLPPIHPIGHTHRKGKNNAPAGGPSDPGSPWAIGALEGGHKAIHPDLGTLDDFRRLMERAGTHGIEIALDIAFQCSPDHPYVKEHREWFRIRPDGTVQYAENPPKKYQDIFPLEFETRPMARIVGGVEERHCVLDRAGRADLSGRQSTHETLPLLGMAHQRNRDGAPRRHFSC